MYDEIVIAVDGSEEAKRAARRGLQFGQAFDASITLLTVVERKALRLTETPAERTTLRERRANVLADVEDLARELGQPVTTELLEGNPAAQISDYAARADVDLIVVGRQGLTGIGRRFLGGVTERILHRCDVPVFVVPDEEDDRKPDADCSRVLVTTDGSENADSAIPHGTAIARRFGSDIHVLNVVDLQAAGGVFDAGGLETAFVERLEAQGRDAVHGVVSEIEDAAPDVTVRSAVERTSSFEGAAAGIRAYIENEDVDLVVMASRGRSSLKRQLLGSVASAVLRTVDVPVVVVKRFS